MSLIYSIICEMLPIYLHLAGFGKPRRCRKNAIVMRGIIPPPVKNLDLRRGRNRRRGPVIYAFSFTAFTSSRARASASAS